MRTILAVDAEARSVTFAGDIPEGSCARLMSPGFDRLVDGAHVAGAEAIAPLAGHRGGTPVLDFSRVGRLVLGERSEEAQQIRLYSDGAPSPTGAGVCRFHNRTMAVTTVSETR